MGIIVIIALIILVVFIVKYDENSKQQKRDKAARDVLHGFDSKKEREEILKIKEILTKDLE